MTTVVNKKHEAFDVYIGRPSIFGNPFQVFAYGRDGAIREYKKWFLKKVENDAAFRAKALALKGKRLGCFCSPLRCHGDVLVEWLEAVGKAT